MKPAITAAALRDEAGGNFLEELMAHLGGGYVISTGRLFAMGRPVPRHLDPSDLSLVWPIEDCDAWFIWLAVGDLRELLALLPFDLPWIGWHRQGRAWEVNHWRPLASVRRRAACREPFKPA